jgi:hypothetical protein
MTTTEMQALVASLTYTEKLELTKLIAKSVISPTIREALTPAEQVQTLAHLIEG